jgi:hypothetical protein
MLMFIGFLLLSFGHIATNQNQVVLEKKLIAILKELEKLKKEKEK